MSELQVIEQNEIALAFQNYTSQDLFNRIQEQAKSVVFDLNDAKQQKELKSLVYKIRQSKTAFDAHGKTLKEQYTEVTNKIDAERRVFKNSCDSLINELLEPLLEIELKEEQRKKDIQPINAITEIPAIFAESKSSDIRNEIERLKSIEISSEIFMESETQAKIAKFETIEALEKLESQRIEFEKKQEEEFKRQQEEQARLQAERDERIKQQAIAQAEAAAKQREQQLIEQAQRDKQRAEQAEANAKIQAEQAAQKERERIAAEQAAEAAAEEQRKQQTRHRNKILKEAIDSYVSQGILDEAAAKIAIKAIFEGKIKNVSIQF